MTRAECLAQLEPYIETMPSGYRGIRFEIARDLIGAGDRFDALCKDRIRNLPGMGWFYFWNVLDYLGWPTIGSNEYRYGAK